MGMMESGNRELKFVGGLRGEDLNIGNVGEGFVTYSDEIIKVHCFVAMCVDLIDRFR